MMKHYYFSTHFVGSFLLSALLPPRDKDEPSFYEILGIENSITNTATEDEIRKAYRKLSLKLHPDKIAQQRNRLPREDYSKFKEEAQVEYEKIQEAYSVLIDETKRLKYDALGTPTRYRFVEQQAGFSDPQALYDNLSGASFMDKSRLVGLFFVAILLLLLQPILIAAKVNQSLQMQGGALENASWFAILVPYWVIGGLILIVTFIAVFFVPAQDILSICLTGFEQLFWYFGVIFLWYVLRTV